MCGVAGFLLSKNINPLKSENILRSMANQLTHRGPDSIGVWSDLTVGLGMAHRRLAILDLSVAGHQPMRSRDGRYVISRCFLRTSVLQ